MNVLSLFSGIGGLDLAAEWAGFRTVAFCEINPFCQKVLKKHWPAVPLFPDIRMLTMGVLKSAGISKIDIMAGGFPCTQTSVAAAITGNRKGLQGQDSKLWFEYKRLIDEIRAKWVVVENPAGVATWKNEIQSGLANAGYTVSIMERTAVGCGLPHERKRYFFVANIDGKRLEIARETKSPTLAWFARLAASGGSWLEDTPGISRSDYGISDRMDRIKALGNAVSPEQAEPIFAAIAAVERGEGHADNRT